MKGWVLDTYADHERDLMDLWIVDGRGGRSMLAHRFHPEIKVAGENLGRLEQYLSDMEGIKEIIREKSPLDIQDRKPRKHLRLIISRYSLLTSIAKDIEAFGRYRDYSLYDVDLRLPSRYMYSHGIFPLASIQVAGGFSLLKNSDWGESPLPPLKASVLHVIPDQDGPVPNICDRIRSVRIGELVLDNEKEDRMIMAVAEELKRTDPDIVITYGGDTFVLPYLYERAVKNDLAKYLKLDRSGKPFRAPQKTGRTYFSYGQVKYKPPFYPMRGRLHLDLENSFLLREGGLIGVALLSRMSLLPVQTMARLSPGSAISYMECVEAMRRGRSVRWKKNDPEGWKTAVELSRSDRGGHIFDPIVGAYSNVIEMDFSSFYPHIMWKKNLSVETLNCDCCRGNQVPGLEYRFCERSEGLIPSVVGGILTKRMRYKTSFKEERTSGPYEQEEELGPIRPPSGKDRYYHLSNTLKWVLVTCFGYTGYKNARFGRIEVHESITAYARDLLLKAKEIVEEQDFSILHGIVDSLWIEGPRDRADETASIIESELGIPIGVDTVYKWLVFTPNKLNGAGALNRYYGLREDGTFKFRGIASRQRSTPPFMKEALTEMIESLSGAESADEVPDHLYRAFDVMRKRGALVINREVPPLDLAITIRPSKGLDEYTTRSEHVAAMKLLKMEGESIQGGQKVRFVIKDHCADRPGNRVALLKEDMSDVKYDINRYLELCARYMAQALAVFGVDEPMVKRALRGVEQRGLDDFA
jgi:DNA polymerase elongation subunit (family B)